MVRKSQPASGSLPWHHLTMTRTSTSMLGRLHLPRSLWQAKLTTSASPFSFEICCVKKVTQCRWFEHYTRKKRASFLEKAGVSMLRQLVYGTPYKDQSGWLQIQRLAAPSSHPFRLYSREDSWIVAALQVVKIGPLYDPLWRWKAYSWRERAVVWLQASTAFCSRGLRGHLSGMLSTSSWPAIARERLDWPRGAVHTEFRSEPPRSKAELCEQLLQPAVGPLQPKTWALPA